MEVGIDRKKVEGRESAMSTNVAVRRPSRL